MKIKSNKFILDQEGEGRPAKLSSGILPKAEDTLGYDPLVQKERQVILIVTVTLKYVQGYDAGDSEQWCLYMYDKFSQGDGTLLILGPQD